MLNKYELVGKSKAEIKDILGKETEKAYFKRPENIVYFLGDERGLISIDSEWLIITFRDNIAISVEIKND